MLIIGSAKHFQREEQIVGNPKSIGFFDNPEIVALWGSNIIWGMAPFHSYGSTQYQGAVYVFVEPASGWADSFQNAELRPLTVTKMLRWVSP